MININLEVAKMYITRMIRSMFEFKLMEYKDSYADRREEWEFRDGWIKPYLEMMRMEDSIWTWLERNDGKIE